MPKEITEDSLIYLGLASATTQPYLQATGSRWQSAAAPLPCDNAPRSPAASQPAGTDLPRASASGPGSASCSACKMKGAPQLLAGNACLG